ncbi:MAG: glycosyltransferase [Candidatus Cloacimonetes bacterium]|nr:glycosyltransferase [Candidatus Cloacimonadota bacterium]
MKKLNGISIVIATKGRLLHLEKLLQSVLIARNNFTGSSEVLIIDDSSEDETKIIDSLCEKYSAQKYFFTPSVSGKRNYGSSKAQYDIILYLDSDCVASPNLLTEHYKMYSDDSIGGVAGLLIFTGEENRYWHVVDQSPFVVCFKLPGWLYEVPWTPTANFSIRKNLFTEIGEFDTDFPNKPGGEDVDLGLRLTKKGYKIRCSKTGIVYHAKDTWSHRTQMRKRVWHYGKANYYLIKKHYDYSISCLPKKSIVHIIIFIMILIMAIISQNPMLLGLFPIYLIADIIATAIIFSRVNKKRKITFYESIGIYNLKMINELGFISESIKHNKLNYINRDMVYFDGQMTDILSDSAVNVWSLIIALTIITTLVSILISIS